MQELKAKDDAEKAAAVGADETNGETVAAEEGVVNVPKMEGSVLRPSSKKEGEWVSRWLSTGGTGKTVRTLARPSSLSLALTLALSPAPVAVPPRPSSPTSISSQADILCCYKSKEKKKLLNAMKLYIATDIRCGTEPQEQEEGLFIITVRGATTPTLALALALALSLPPPHPHSGAHR